MMNKLAFLVGLSLTMGLTAAFAAEDKTVAYGETLDITADTTYANLVVNGTLNVAEGVKLTCDTFILGDNLDHTQDKVARMTVGSTASVKVNNSETLSESSYVPTGYCKIGVNSRAELTLEEDSVFTAGGRMVLASCCTSTASRVGLVKVNVNNAKLVVGGQIEFSGRRATSDSGEGAVLSLNGRRAVANPRCIRLEGDENHYVNGRIRFNGGKVSCTGWWRWGQDSVITCARCAQTVWLESVDGNPIHLASIGGDCNQAFFWNKNSWLGLSQYVFEGAGPLVLECTEPNSSMRIFYNTDDAPSGLKPGSLGLVRVIGKLSLKNPVDSTGLNTLVAGAKLEIGCNAELDLYGRALEAGSLESVGTIKSTDGAAVLTAGSDNGDVVLSSPTLEAGVKLVKTGTGKLRVPASFQGEIEVAEGGFDFCDRKSVGFPYYRYWVYKPSIGGGDGGTHCTVVQLAEIELYKDGVSVRDQATHASYCRFDDYGAPPVNLFETDDDKVFRSRWFTQKSAAASNSCFFVAHFGNAPAFNFTGLRDVDPGAKITPDCDAIAAAPALGSLNGQVTSYKFKTGANEWYAWQVPEYFRFQGGLGGDVWVDLEDWEARGRRTYSTSDAFVWTEEFPLAYPVNPVTVETLTVAAGTEWTIDCQQADLTVGTLTLGSTGTLRLTNFGKVRSGKPLPVKYTAINGAGNLANWDVYVDGVLCDREVLAENGRLVFDRIGMMLILR